MSDSGRVNRGVELRGGIERSLAAVILFKMAACTLGKVVMVSFHPDCSEVRIDFYLVETITDTKGLHSHPFHPFFIKDLHSRRSLLRESMKTSHNYRAHVKELMMIENTS